jgi:CheY-like chemotaxis protein
VLERAPAGRPPAAASGHGLGLHIVRQIADQHGGELTLTNGTPRGAEALLRFPASLCVDAEPDPAHRPPAPRRPSLDGLRVLLAEDSPTNQMVAMQMLRALHAEVTVCSDGVEALELFELAHFDIVVVDIEMPRLSGLDVIRTIRARTDGRAGVPIVALTAYALREHRDRVLEAGANGLISKPISSIEALGRDLAAHVAAPMPEPAPSPASQSDDEGPVVDLAIYGALTEAIGAEMMGELLDKVIADLLSAREALAGAVDPLDRAPIRSASHILISVAGAIGANRLQEAARRLNTAAHATADDGIADQARRCIDEIDAATAFARERRGG